MLLRPVGSISLQKIIILKASTFFNRNKSMVTDPIADYLTRIRNAIKAQHGIVKIPASNIKKEITKVLYEKGYIRHYKFYDENDVK